MEPILLSISDTSKALGIGRTKIYDLIEKGNLCRVKIGRRSSITVDSIRKLAASKPSIES